MQYLTSYFCVCLFAGFLLNLALYRSREAAGRERGAGSGRAERRGEAEPGGPGGPAGLSAHRSRRRSWGRRQPRLRCPGQGQGPRGRGPGQPQARGCHGRYGAPVCPSSSPGVPHQSPARTCRAQRMGRGAKAAPGRERPELPRSSCPGAGHRSGSEETNQPRVFLFVWLVFMT